MAKKLISTWQQKAKTARPEHEFVSFGKKIISETVLDMKQPSLLCECSKKTRAHNAHNIVPRRKFGGLFVSKISLTSI